jgi:putative nucleotidyltransferase with HDIG domain
MISYIPINPNNLKVGTKIGCDLYLLVETSADKRYVLYCRKEAVFEEGKKEMLVEKKVGCLYIKQDEEEEFFEYMEKHFQEIMTDTNVSNNEKAKIVHDTAANVVKNLFDDPRSGNIKRTKEFASNMADYIIDDSNAAESLLKIAKQDYYTYTHCVNVAAVGTLFAKNIGLGEDELRVICSGVLLHDIGKTRISADIINKKGKLTKEEFEEMKKHPELGVKVLDEAGITTKHERIITLQHHENDDGSGYPYGLKKEEIHLYGKIIRILDVYDAITTNRSYSDAKRSFAALKEMHEKMRSCFDTDLFFEFISYLGPNYPREKQRKNDKLNNLPIEPYKELNIR